MTAEFEIIRNATREGLDVRPTLEDAIESARELAEPNEGDVVIRGPEGDVVARVYHDGMVEEFD